MHLVQAVGLEPMWNSQSTADKLAACLLDVYTQLQSAFALSQQPHYLFTPRHLSLLATGLQSYSLHGSDLLQACPCLAACLLAALIPLHLPF